MCSIRSASARRLLIMEKEKVRKGGQTQGVRTQKMMSFRIDNDLLEWLDTKVNKGRYINELIRRDKEVQS